MFKKLCLIIGFVMYSAITAYAGLEDESGWFSRGVGTFTIENGELSVDSPPEMETFAWKNISDELGFDNFTLRLKAKVSPDKDKTIVIYFCDERYKCVIKDDGGTETLLYNREWYTMPWKVLQEFPDIITIEHDKWYDIEVKKYNRSIQIKFDDQGYMGYILGVTDHNYEGGGNIALGAYNSHVHYNDVKILPSVTGTVTSTNNKPIEKAKVAIFKSSSGELIKQATTKSDGSYAILGIWNEMNFDIRISKQGYKEEVLINQQIKPFESPEHEDIFTITFSPSLEPLVSKDDVFCYPNPAKDIDRINFMYNLDIQGKVIIKIYNIAGEFIDKIEEYKGAGVQVSTWNIPKIASGIYLYILGTDKIKKVGKFAIIR